MHIHPTSNQASSTLKPFLKWAGGKQRLLPHLREVLPPGKRLIEPFLGAGSVFLGTDYPEYLLGDANPDLMAVWVALQSNPAEYVSRAERLFSRENTSADAYARLRGEFNTSTDRLERAALFLYLNRFGFNGVFRVNGSGNMNTPYGYPKVTPSFPAAALEGAAMKLSLARLHIGGFSALMDQAGAGDVVYCDPPYSDVGNPSFTAYTRSRFGEKEHEELISSARLAASRGAFVAISNHANEYTRSLYKGFETHELVVRRSVATKSEARGQAREILAILKPGQAGD